MVAKKKTEVKKTPPKKMSPAESVKQAKKNSAAIQGKKVIHIPAAKPAVFVNQGRRVFLLVEELGEENLYVTRQDEEIKLVSLTIGAPQRDSKGNAIEETHCTQDLKAYPLSDPKLVATSLMNSGLPKQPKAIARLCEFLGLPIPEIPVEVQQRRKAAGDRLKAARPERVGYTIQQLCTKLDIEPSDARKALRKGKVEKPQAGWVWPTEVEADAAAKQAGLIVEKKSKKK